jgi:glycosyltransferase involved in cell wall biosynthesis
MDMNPSKKTSSISAVFPAYNDAGTIPSIIITSLMALRLVTDDYEIIVTNDGSHDHTSEVLEEMSKRYPELRVIHHPQNRGYGAALRTGFQAATRDWVFYTDGDAQYNPLELVNLVGALGEGIDIVNGYKIARSDPLIRKMIGRTYHYMVSFVFGIRLKDVDCDFRLMRRSALMNIQLESYSGSICVELIKKLQDDGCVFAEVPVHHYHRQYGHSQFFNFRRIFNVARQLIALYWKLIVKKQHLR